jgi:hypothetical protein
MTTFEHQMFFSMMTPKSDIEALLVKLSSTSVKILSSDSGLVRLPPRGQRRKFLTVVAKTTVEEMGALADIAASTIHLRARTTELHDYPRGRFAPRQWDAALAEMFA